MVCLCVGDLLHCFLATTNEHESHASADTETLQVPSLSSSETNQYRGITVFHFFLFIALFCLPPFLTPKNSLDKCISFLKLSFIFSFTMSTTIVSRNQRLRK